MSVKFGISGVDPNSAKESNARVSENGEVIVRSYGFSEPSLKSLTTTSPANLFTAKASMQLVLTGIVISANRSILQAGDLVEVYEASAADSATQTKPLFSVDIARQQAVPLLGLQTLITQGKYLNVDRADATGAISVTALGYYVPTLS
jgi:hypothetical protein